MVKNETNTMTEKKFQRMSTIESCCAVVTVPLLARAKLTSSDYGTPVLSD